VGGAALQPVDPDAAFKLAAKKTAGVAKKK
jgi:hypothetical protein